MSNPKLRNEEAFVVMLARAFVAIAALSLLVSCAAVVDEPARTPPEFMESAKPIYYLNEQDIDNYFGMNSEQRQVFRDGYITKGVIHITENYHAFKDNLYKQDTISDLGLDFATLGIAGAGTFIEGTQTLQILHAVVAGLIGAKAAVDRRALFQQTVDTVVDKMDAQRAQVELRLLSGREKSLEQYPLLAAYRDMRAFYEAGTIKGALSGLAATASVEREAAEQRVNTRTFKFQLDEPAQNLRDALCTDDDCTRFNETVLTAVRACQQNLGLTNVLLIDLVFADEHASSRAKIEQCLRDNGVI